MAFCENGLEAGYEDAACSVPIRRCGCLGTATRVERSLQMRGLHRLYPQKIRPVRAAWPERMTAQG